MSLGRTATVYLPIHLGDAVIRRRASLGIGVREAAHQAGVSPATFNRVELGGTPDVWSLIKLSAWAKVRRITRRNRK